MFCIIKHKFRLALEFVFIELSYKMFGCFELDLFFYVLADARDQVVDLRIEFHGLGN